MKKRLIALALLLSAGRCLASSADHSCALVSCFPGDKGVTYATKAEPFLACPTRELADYTGFVLSLISLSISLTGRLPNISDKTGDPEYIDGQDGPNKTRLMLDMLRSRAGVSTFDDAEQRCKNGIGNDHVLVMNVPENGYSIWVRDTKRNQSFWMPKSSLDKQ